MVTSLLAYQVGELSNVRRDPARLILRQQLGRRPSPRLILVIDVSELLSVSVTYDGCNSADQGAGKRRGEEGMFSKEGHQKSDGLSRVTAPLSQRRGS